MTDTVPDETSDRPLIELGEFLIPAHQVAADISNSKWLISRGDKDPDGPLVGYEVRIPEADMCDEYWHAPTNEFRFAGGGSPLAGRTLRARYLPTAPARVVGSADALLFLVDLEQKGRHRRSSGRLADEIVAAATGPLAGHPDSLWMLVLGIEGQELWPR
jgi:hypothetical protein